MRDIILLIKCEFKKYYKLNLISIGVLLMFIIMGAVTIGEYKDMQRYNASNYSNERTMTWREREENIIKFGTESLSDPWYNDTEKEQIVRRIEVAKYHLDNNIPKEITKNMWWFFNDNKFEWIIRLVIILTVFAGCINIGQEFSKKTINQMLLLPYRRDKLLLAKYLTMMLYGLMLFSIVFLLGTLSGIIIHGFEGLNSAVVLNNGSEITTISMTSYSLIIVALKLVELTFFTVLAGMIAVLFKSGAVASVVGVLVALIGAPISFFFSSYYGIVNYFPLNNLDFRRYLDFGRVMPEINNEFSSIVVHGITPLLSAIIVGTTMIVFIGIAFSVFKRRDVK